ncbi:MAG: transcriptional regulator, TetR family [Acidimicrobiales bacterium]|nr:transcriptional regulator, TetR family [Acidimicrobiales bacterium]
MQAMAEKLTPERRRELTRTALLDAAADVFAKRGFHAASLEEIAEAAGFTRGAIYKNFENKEELFLTVIERRIEAQLERFSDAFREDGAAAAMDADRLMAVWAGILDTDPDWFTLDLEFRLYAMRNPEARARWVAHEREFCGLVARFIKEQSDALGVSIKLPAETVAGIMLPASQGFWQWAFLDPEQSHLYSAFLELVIGAVVEGPSS